MTAIRMAMMLTVLFAVSGCGGDGLIDNSCDEPQRYQSAVEGRRIDVPEGLDPLDERAEMPIPKPQEAPVRPPGSPCIELPPAVRTSKQDQ